MNATQTIEQTLRHYPKQAIIDAHQLYLSKFASMSQTAFYKALSRLEQNGLLYRLARGVYCVPKHTKFGLLLSSEAQIIEYLIGSNENKGVLIGHRLFNRYGLTTQISKNVSLYTNKIRQKKRNIKNVMAHRVDLTFNHETNRLVELLEVLEHYKTIEDLNLPNLINYIKASVQYYDKNSLKKIQNAIGYKKRTLASLKNILDYYGVEHSIQTYLNETSNYDAINLESLNELTQ